jgi:hypothetical protein
VDSAVEAVIEGATAASTDVQASLLLIRSRMDELVVSYGAADQAVRVGAAIDGTAFYPGGTGLWRGREPFGALPLCFPRSPVMLVGHNFDSVVGYEQSLERGIERLNGPTWRYLLQYLDHAGILPGGCFFTNALMGLQPVSARGAFSVSADFRAECRRFLQWQIDFIAPSLVVVLGNDALAEFRQVRCDAPSVSLRHPMSVIYTKMDSRTGLIEHQANLLRAALPDVCEEMFSDG